MKVTKIRAGEYQVSNGSWKLGTLKKYYLWYLQETPSEYWGKVTFCALKQAKAYLIEYYNQEKK